MAVVGVTRCRCPEPRVAWGGAVCSFCGGLMAREAPAPAMELVTGGAQVEAAAHVAFRLLGESIELTGAGGDPTVAAELVERAYATLAHGLGLPRVSSARSDEEMHELARDEQHLDQIAGRAA